ncbi:MAG: hypothetical protein KDC80_00140, partial [Saprospiraceae bacterium]|nr:hypothetical protein [Saprospiraceae bacterium]
CPFVEDLMADSITNTSVVVVWSTFGDNTVYELTVSDGQGNDMVVAPASPPQFIQGLSPDTEYEVSVVAHCEDGVPSQVNLFFTTGEEIADTCSIPENLDASMEDSSSFTLSWDPVSGAESYDLQINDLDTVPNLLVDTNIVEALYLFQVLDSLEGYTFRVRALCSAESMSDWSEYYFFPSATDSLVLACETPTDLMVDTVIGNNVFLSWTPTDAIGFEVEIQDGVNTMTKTVGAISEIGSVYFSGLEAMTTYQARIRPICREEEGDFSIAISFTTGEVMIICLPVTDLSAERVDDNTASLSWSEIDGATYETEVRSKGSSSGMLTIPSFDPELMVSGLDPALIYEFRVRSICSSGDTSLFTHWISFSTEDPQVGTCTAPTGINLDSVNSTEAWISWLGVDTLEYQVFWKEKDTIAAPEVYMTTEHFIYLDSLMPETEYMIQVQKLCGDELSPLSEPFYFTTLMIGDSVPDSLCVAPYDLKLDSVDVNDAWISWMAEDSLLFEVEVTGVDFEYLETVGMNMIWLTGLTENAEYTLRVRSLCTDSTSSEWSEDFIFQTLEMPEEPEDSCRLPIAELISIGAESAMGSWTSSSSGAFYLIEVENIGLTPNYRLITTTRDTSYLFEDLVPGGTYQWKVAAFCPDGSYSDCTEWMTFTTDGAEDCEAPDGLAVDQLTTTGAMLIWNNAPSAIDYEVEIQSLDTTPFYGVSNILLENQLSVDGLVPGGSYQFKVNVQCLDGTISEDSDWYLFSTLTGQDTGTISNSVAQRVQMVFPNPVRQTMSVKLPEALLENTANIELTDMMGRVVRSIEQAGILEGTLIRIEVGDLREGIYQLSVRSEDKFYHELVMIAR